MCKYDVNHKTGSTGHIATPPEEGRIAVMANVHCKFGEFERVVRQICLPTDRHTDMMLIKVLRSLSGAE